MPQSLSLVNGQSFTIPEKVAQLSIQLWGAGGGGETVNTSNFVRTAGTDGGDTQLLGLKATGGKRGTTPGGGGRGGGSSPFPWSNYGVSVGLYDGNISSTPGAGNGATIGGIKYGNGGSGSPGTTTYYSTVYHVFNNDTNQHYVTQASSDIYVSYNNPWASDGVPCGMQSYGKNYGVYFYNAFTNSTYNVLIYNICQQTAGGGSGKAPYSLDGVGNQTSAGFQVWFRNTECINSYIRCFSIQATGTKAGAQGMGGGGAGGASANFTKQNLIDSITYAPGTNHTAIVGQGGTGYINGGDGRINIYMVIQPTVTLTSTSTSIIVGQCVTLSWQTTGDADNLYWIAGNISNGNLTSSESVCPQITTIYTAQASGLGGLSDPAAITVRVYYVATGSLEAPSEIDYGDSLFVGYTTQYADISISIIPIYYYVDGTNTAGDTINITPAITAESGKPDSETIVSSDGIQIPITWGTLGPERVSIQLVAVGNGGTANDILYVDVNIDTTPDNLSIPETDDAFKDQDPIYTPDTTVLSELLYIDDIDIPVKIKSNQPIKVDVNQQDIWLDVEEI